MNGSWLLIDATGDGSCMTHAAFKHPAVKKYCDARKIKDGLELRSHVIDEMMSRHADTFRTICNACVVCGKDGLDDAALAKFVEEQLKPTNQFLGIDFALMISIILGMELVLVSNTNPVITKSTSDHADLLKVSIPSESGVGTRIHLFHHRFNNLGDQTNFTNFNHFALMIEANLLPDVAKLRKKHFPLQKTSKPRMTPQHAKSDKRPRSFKDKVAGNKKLDGFLITKLAGEPSESFEPKVTRSAMTSAHPSMLNVPDGSSKRSSEPKVIGSATTPAFPFTSMGIVPAGSSKTSSKAKFTGIPMTPASLSTATRTVQNQSRIRGIINDLVVSQRTLETQILRMMSAAEIGDTEQVISILQQLSTKLNENCNALHWIVDESKPTSTGKSQAQVPTKTMKSSMSTLPQPTSPEKPATSSTEEELIWIQGAYIQLRHGILSEKIETELLGKSSEVRNVHTSRQLDSMRGMTSYDREWTAKLKTMDGLSEIQSSGKCYIQPSTPLSGDQPAHFIHFTEKSKVIVCICCEVGIFGFRGKKSGLGLIKKHIRNISHYNHALKFQWIEFCKQDTAPPVKKIKQKQLFIGQLIKAGEVPRLVSLSHAWLLSQKPTLSMNVAQDLAPVFQLPVDLISVQFELLQKAWKSSELKDGRVAQSINRVDTIIKQLGKVKLNRQRLGYEAIAIGDVIMFENLKELTSDSLQFISLSYDESECVSKTSRLLIYGTFSRKGKGLMRLLIANIDCTHLTTGKNLFKLIFAKLNDLGLACMIGSLNTDGASAVCDETGWKSSSNTRLIKKLVYARGNWCVAHRINLSLGEALKTIPSLTILVQNLARTFTGKSTKRHAMLKEAVEQMSEFLDKEDLIKFGKVRTISKYIAVRWLSFMTCVEKVVKLYIPLLTTLNKLNLPILENQFREHLPFLIFLNDLAPYYRTLISRVQQLNAPWTHKLLSYTAEFLVPFYTSFYSRDAAATALMLFPVEVEHIESQQKKEAALRYLRGPGDRPFQVDTNSICTSNGIVMDKITSITDPTAVGLSEPNWDSYPRFKLWLADHPDDDRHESVKAAVVKFSQTLFCSLNRRLSISYRLMKALSMLDPRRWSYFSEYQNADERLENIKILLNAMPLLLKCGVKGSLGLDAIESNEADHILDLFKCSSNGEDKVPSEMKEVLKARILNSSNALFVHRAQMGKSNPLVEVGEHEDLCLYYQEVGSLDPSYGAICAVFEYSLCNLLASVVCESGFSRMNLSKNSVRNQLSHRHCTSTMRTQDHVRENPQLKKPTIEFLKKLDQHPIIRASRKARKELRKQQRAQAEELKHYHPRNISEAPSVMARALREGGHTSDDSSSSDSSSGDSSSNDASSDAPDIKSSAAAPRVNKAMRKYTSLLSCDSYSEGQTVLARYEWVGETRLYAGTISGFSTSTGLYTVAFRDGEVRTDVKHEELLDGWFRKGMVVYAPLEDTDDSGPSYRGKITETNYLDGMGMMKEALPEDPLVTMMFDKVPSEKKPVEEIYKPIRNIYFLLSTDK